MNPRKEVESQSPTSPMEDLNVAAKLFSDEDEAVLEDGFGPEDTGNSSLVGCSTSDRSILLRSTSAEYLGGSLISPMERPPKYIDLSDEQKREILFPPRTFDFLRDDIRQTIVNLIDCKLGKEDPDLDSDIEPQQKASQSSGDDLLVFPDKIAPEKNSVDSIKISDDAKSDLGGSQKQKSGDKPESFVIVHNVAKRHNLGTLARSATAFGVSELILVGRKDFNAFGSHGATLHMQFRHFQTLPQAVEYLKAKHVAICGVEITEGATGVQSHPFTCSTAFLLGNEGTGLSRKEMDICDFFIYIPQYGAGTGSLNVTVAASIVLHHFAVWAGFPEQQREGQKYVVAERPVRRGPRNICADTPAEVANQRRQNVEFAREDWLLSEAIDDTGKDNGSEVVAEHPIKSFTRMGQPSSLNTLFD
ncbi:hypothetical protein BDL97_18G067500 [Sphagnum fallax]|nr:hypothetical protein BDL97_18G067500 [Sphagnum fallax]KAH8934139.1 hypothetical protein BDL97_18G067500 [Sphagnum fallax]KAH8934140.1 hypothetical protein BDL97_18G067500 [Sphagnum fallax]KAH8934141.1 hypothetical protein BDL97_18G067500 [Sphagnum fallax]KAH8934142.1 hypothetical protein BDL97_18G067500 [Sphagnum fallax]